MGEYVRKIPYYNNYEEKKDLLKFTFLHDKKDDEKREINKNDEVQFIIKKRENMKDILTHLPHMNTRTQGDILNERKNKLKEDMSTNFNTYEKRFPFLIDSVVKNPEQTRDMKDVLNNKYVDDNTIKYRISQNVVTKTMLLEERKKNYKDELRGHNIEDNEKTINYEDIYLDPEKNYTDIVKNKNKLLTLKNYGLGQGPSNFVFSYPDIKAKGRGGYASEIVKSNILKNKNEYSKNKIQLNIQNLQDKDIYSNREEKSIYMNAKNTLK
ncbi:hypothetical protein PFNF135_03703 [Plasmodium falciparum NF135/5.C10]|uniref:Uncharacterized protein n=1 Tax=Plasmodium falciparum NF135/5.C10 TaxID=1036726 RepID=W4IGI1_PLAFA|nr:hypothetical protein PFNF135_03703 [Plasmodium falciparum NF135/5.C10]